MKTNKETKQYESPSIRVIQVEENSLICTSGTTVTNAFGDNEEEDW